MDGYAGPVSAKAPPGCAVRSAAEDLAKAASPRMTSEIIARGSLVFCDFQNARHHAAADEFHDRPGTDWRDAAGDAMAASRPQADDRLIGVACDLCLVAARKA